MDESAQEKEERLTRREERLERQHNRIMESRNAPPRNTSGGSGGFLGGIGAFIGDHKIAVIAVAVIVVFLSIITALKKQSSNATNANTANQSPNYGAAGYQTSGEATAFQQLGQQLNNISSQLTNLTPTIPGSTTTTTPPSTNLMGTVGLGTPPYNQKNTGFPIRSLPGAVYGKQSDLLYRAPFGSSLQLAGPPVTGTSNYGVGKQGGSNLWYPVVGGGYISAMDITNVGPSTQNPSVVNSGAINNGTSSNIFNPGSTPNQAVVLQQK